MNTTKYVTVLQDTSSKLFLTPHVPFRRGKIDTLAHARTFRSCDAAVKEQQRLNALIELKDRNLKKYYVVRFIPLGMYEAAGWSTSDGRPAV